MLLDSRLCVSVYVSAVNVVHPSASYVRGTHFPIENLRPLRHRRLHLTVDRLPRLGRPLNLRRLSRLVELRTITVEVNDVFMCKLVRSPQAFSMLLRYP